VRKVLVLFLLLAGGAAAFGQQDAVVLDEAISSSMTYLVGRLPKGIKVVVLNFDATTKKLADYVIEELTGYIVNDDNLTVVDRRNLELLQQEMDFQTSGEVSDATAQAIGQKLGAQTIISGSLSSLGGVWRMRIQAIQVETAQIQGVQTTTVKLDSTLAALLDIPYQDGPVLAEEEASPEDEGSKGRPKKPRAEGDFSGGRRVAAAFLNIALGLGSYTMGDWGGGLTITAGYAVAGGLLVWEILGLDWDSKLVGVPAIAGMSVAGVTVVYGFIRPFIYHKRPALAKALEGFKIVILPDERGIKAMSLFYTHRF
jgi:TolB-like protein